MIAPFRVIVVEVNSNDPGGSTAQMLGVVDIAQPVLGGPMTEIVPVTKGGGGETGEDHFPEIVRGNFPRIFPALKAQANAQGRGLFADAEKNFLHPRPGFLKSFFVLANGTELLLNKGA